MCGIAGIYYFNGRRAGTPANHEKILNLLRHRGPDNQTYKTFTDTTLYHSRLKIVDTSEASNQPFMDKQEKEALVFNGEIFNYKTIQIGLSQLHTSGDTEVLFELLRRDGKKCLDQLNGFFAFAYYNENENYLLLCRDRLGVKPIYYYRDDEKFVFASELKPLMALAGAQELNEEQVYSYFRLNYCAGQATIFKNVFKLLPGQLIEIKNKTLTIETWYHAPKTAAGNQKNNNIVALLDDAVKLRLHADVAVGTFLSGGLDSSIISALAKNHKPDLKTFSIGFEDASYFDETRYSEMVAKHIQSDHLVFKLKEDDFLANLDAFLAAIDEPFADSSAFNFYMLSKYTSKQVKVALSGDGADELFKGYNKHKALLMSENFSVRMFAAFASFVPIGNTSRSGRFSNRLRQMKKFNALNQLPAAEKQKFLASISDNRDVNNLLKQKNQDHYFNSLFSKGESFRDFGIDDVFDLQTVLADDMLVKADRFSMQHGIEIRNPFLDYRLVELALNLPADQKISRTRQKIILKDSFKHLLPAEIFSRSKKGFELPLQKWLSGSLRAKLEKDWLNKEKLSNENILNIHQVELIKKQMFSDNHGDSAAKLWAVIIFESWLTNFKDYIKH